MDGLTPRQREVLSLVASGLTSREIAGRLGISESAIKGHLSRLYDRYRVGNRAGLIASAMARNGLPVVCVADDFEAYRKAPFIVAVTEGPEHVYRFVNDAAARTAGRSDLVGHAVRAVYPDLDPRFAAGLDAAYRNGTVWSVANAPARLPHPNGTFRDTTLDLFFQPLRGPDGRVWGLLQIGTEVAPAGT